MLNFYNTKIILNIDLNNSIRTVHATSLPYSKEWQTSASYLGNVNIQMITEKPLYISDIECVALSLPEFYAFTKEWYYKSKCERMYMYDFDNWFNCYLNSALSMYERNIVRFDKVSEFNNVTYPDIFAIHTLRNASAHQDFKHGINPIKVPNNPVPELSWMLEDFLEGLAKGRRSQYTANIMKVVEKNIRDIQYCMSCFNTMASVIEVDLKLTTSGNNDKVISEKELVEELDNQQAVFYFQTPFVFHRFETNYKYIQLLLDRYNERNDK